MRAQDVMTLISTHGPQQFVGMPGGRGGRGGAGCGPSGRLLGSAGAGVRQHLLRLTRCSSSSSAPRLIQSDASASTFVVKHLLRSDRRWRLLAALPPAGELLGRFSGLPRDREDGAARHREAEATCCDRRPCPLSVHWAVSTCPAANIMRGRVGQ
ncbi:hypothetical protein E2C01_052165 [Portunus trituberculatus]|uniref:Uncharacterized protein n=1 Tax=Portunus trituberculatus TaxID=210409 RepID=A0A5B7GCX7_PORTR|nr:hypothetical protein [Portunus trituberculatus]